MAQWLTLDWRERLPGRVVQGGGRQEMGNIRHHRRFSDPVLRNIANAMGSFFVSGVRLQNARS
jgi:hypothetical protein